MIIMKTSFRKLTVRPTLCGETQTVEDLTEVIAESVYQNTTTFAGHQLAHRLIESGEDIELTDQDVRLIKEAVQNSHLRFFVKRPILEVLGEKFED